MPADWKTIKAKNEQRAKHIADMQSLMKAANTEKRSLTADEDKKFNQLHAEAEAIGKDIRQLEQLGELEDQSAAAGNGDRQKRDQQAGRGDAGGGRDLKEIVAEERSQFDAWLRTGSRPIALERRAEEVLNPEMRSMAVGNTVVGPRDVAPELVKTMALVSGVREAGAKTYPRSTSNPFAIPTGSDTSNTGELVAEATSSTTSADATIGNKTLTPWQYRSKWLKLSLELIRDPAYDVVAEVVAWAGVRIGNITNSHFTTGDDSSKPNGVVTASTLGVTAASTSAITYEELVNLIFSVNKAYRNDPTFAVMGTDATYLAIIKLKDGDNRYIFPQGEQAAAGKILGFSYVTNTAMAELNGGAGSKVLLAGAFNRYRIADVSNPLFVRADQLFIESGLIGFNLLSWHDGELADTTAIKHLKLAAA